MIKVATLFLLIVDPQAAALARQPRLTSARARGRPLALDTNREVEVSTLLLAKDAPAWIVVDADDPVGLVANKLVSAGRGSCALISRDDLIIGIFTERDYLNALNTCEDDDVCLDPEEMERRTVELIASSVVTFATRDLLIVEPSCSVIRALRVMGAFNYRHLPVVRPGTSPDAIPVSAVIDVLATSTLADWVQRDSEALQQKYFGKLQDTNPRWRAEQEAATEAAAAAAMAAAQQPRFPLMIDFTKGDQIFRALVSCSRAYRRLCAVDGNACTVRCCNSRHSAACLPLMPSYPA